MGKINDIINDFQKEELNAHYLKDYDFDFADGEWNWPKINIKIDLLQGVVTWTKDLVVGGLWALQPWHWDDIIKGAGYAIVNIDEVIPAMLHNIKETYQEEGLIYCVGYVLPDVASLYFGVGEIKLATKANKLDEVASIGKYSDEAAAAARIADNVEDLAKAYPELNIPEGYETYHTGRIEFYDMNEKLAMEEVMSNPMEGSTNLSNPDKRKPVVINDPNLPPPPEDWNKYSNNVNESEIHFIYNEKTGQYMDFKFKD